MCRSFPDLVLFFQSLFKECATLGSKLCLVSKLRLRIVFLHFFFRSRVFFGCRPESVVVGLRRSRGLHLLRGAVYLSLLVFVSWTLSLLLLPARFSFPLSWGVSLPAPIRTDHPSRCNTARHHTTRGLVNLEAIAVAIDRPGGGLPLKAPFQFLKFLTLGFNAT